MAENKQILLLAKREADREVSSAADLYSVGTVATILQLLKLPDGTVKVLVEGAWRARVHAVAEGPLHFVADVDQIKEPVSDDRESRALAQSIREQFEQFVKSTKKVPQEVMASLGGIDDPGRLVDTIAAQMSLSLADRQRVLEAAELPARIEVLLGLIDAEIDFFELEKRIRGRVKKQMEKSQREYYLNEQIKAIQKELGDLDESPGELEELERRIEAGGLSAEARKRAQTELGKLKQMSPMSAEATVVRTYLDWLINVPWKARSKVRRDLLSAQRILDEDHYGLEEVKERILEYLAVQSRVSKMKGPVLCLVGPPGVGKTSLARSIARATGRKFVRVALGGVRDEAEIRGHRRTYIGALPGRILQGLRKAESSNPVFLLDEIDKLSSDFRGDPASALLEVLDPEQNSTFNDHYLDLDFDLSKVMFICTANDLRGVPSPLLDRMEVVKIAGYTEAEKLAIATRYLIPKQLAANGLTDEQLRVDRTALQRIVREYTRESGVRNLERELAAVCRKAAVRVVTGGAKTRVRLRAGSVETVLGVPKRRVDRIGERDLIGFVNGLAVNATGGSMVPIEAAVVRGTGKTQLTGSLGSVFQESAQSAVTYMRIRSAELGLKPEFWAEIDLHVHVPEIWGVDGPSAGIGLATAVVSAVCNVPVRRDVAMTGEITLHGMVRPIGGLKEKLLAAAAANIKRVLIPRDNVRDLRDVPASVRESLVIVPVDTMDEVLMQALAADPTDIFRTREAAKELPADAPAQAPEAALPNA